MSNEGALEQHESLIEKGPLLRLVPESERFIPPGQVMPTHLAFEPSSDDKNEQPVRVSVWDRTRCTIAQAQEHRESPKPALPYCFEAADVHAVAANYSAGRLRIVRHELRLEKRKNAGAAGHCGIEGLERQQGEDRTAWRAFLQKIAWCCQPAED